MIISPPMLLKKGGPVVVAACSSSALASDLSRIELPNKADIPQTKSGLPKRCWLIPRWILTVDPTRFDPARYSGYLTGSKLKEVLAAVVEAADS